MVQKVTGHGSLLFHCLNFFSPTERDATIDFKRRKILASRWWWAGKYVKQPFLVWFLWILGHCANMRWGHLLHQPSLLGPHQEPRHYKTLGPSDLAHWERDTYAHLRLISNSGNQNVHWKCKIIIPIILQNKYNVKKIILLWNSFDELIVFLRWSTGNWNGLGLRVTGLSRASLVSDRCSKQRGELVEI